MYLQTVLHYFPLLVPDLLAYQDQIYNFSRKFRASAWIMYDTAFHYLAAFNPSLPWGKINDQCCNDILKEETLPFCISCHSYGHCTISCPTCSQVNQSFHRSPAHGQPFITSSTSSPTSTPKPSITTAPATLSASSRNLTCHDFNHCFCCHVNCQFQHICSK